MKNFTSLTTDSSYVTGFGHNCFELDSLSNEERDFGGLDTSSVFGPSVVIIPPDPARGIFASAEYQFFRDAWAGTPQGADFVREVRAQYNAHMALHRNIGGFRIDFTRLPWANYSAFVRDSITRIFGLGKGVMRGFLGRVSGIVLARAGRAAIDAAHRALANLWQRMHARLMINAAVTTGIVSAGTAYVGLVTSANAAAVAATTTTTAVTTATGASSAFSILSVFSLLFLG